MGHGSGGKMMHDLIRSVFLPALDNPHLRAGNDAAVAQPNPCFQLAISTDAHVVQPLFFPGGDIGRLSVCGTVNDVAMMGAIPRYLTAGFILEEGLEVAVVERVVASMHVAAAEAGVHVVAGDTKVVEKGKADGMYITTAGVGEVLPGTEISGAGAQPGDLVLLSGTLGDHGIAVLEARGELGLEMELSSDVAPLNRMILAMLESSENIHVLRDPTRGGLATTLNEIAGASGMGIVLDAAALPVRPEVQAACEILGFDPLYVANEGKLVAFVAPQDAGKVLEAMQASQYGRQAVVIGRVVEQPRGRVLLETGFGSSRVVDTLMGEMLPRIC
jgi:hydrogenase expression/formation protein HypE